MLELVPSHFGLGYEIQYFELRTSFGTSIIKRKLRYKIWYFLSKTKGARQNHESTHQKSIVSRNCSLGVSERVSVLCCMQYMSYKRLRFNLVKWNSGAWLAGVSYLLNNKNVISNRGLNDASWGRSTYQTTDRYKAVCPIFFKLLWIGKCSKIHRLWKKKPYRHAQTQERQHTVCIGFISMGTSNTERFSSMKLTSRVGNISECEKYQIPDRLKFSLTVGGDYFHIRMT